MATFATTKLAHSPPAPSLMRMSASRWSSEDTDCGVPCTEPTNSALYTRGIVRGSVSGPRTSAPSTTWYACESISAPWWPSFPVITNRNWMFPLYPSSMSMPSSPQKRMLTYFMFTEPPKSSMPSSRLKATSMWSTVVPLPTE